MTDDERSRLVRAHYDRLFVRRMAQHHAWLTAYTEFREQDRSGLWWWLPRDAPNSRH